MFKNNLLEIFPFVQRMFDLSELILVGSNISEWLEGLQKEDVEKVYYINQASFDYRFELLPKNWEVETKLLAQKDGKTTFYEITNSILNGTVNTEVLAKIWKNLETLATSQKEAVSLKRFIEDKCTLNSSKMVVIDSFDGLSILNDLSSLEVDVISIRVIAGDEDEFDFASQKKVNQKLTAWGYKNIATYADNHPKIKTAIYVKDRKQQIKTLQENLEQEKQAKEELAKQKQELENEIQTQQNEKQNLNEKVKTLSEVQNTKQELEDKVQLLRAERDKEKKLKEELQNECDILNLKINESSLLNASLKETVNSLELQVNFINNLFFGGK